MFQWLKGKQSSVDSQQETIAVGEDQTLVVFVCTANLSRSPMAEAMMRHAVREFDDYVIASAGTKSVPGFSPTPEALTVLRTRNYDTSGLQTSRITQSIVDRADFIFVMGDVHLKGILQKYPKSAEKMFLLADLSADPTDRGIDVPDPHEQPLSAYLEVYDLLEHLIPRALTFIEDGLGEEWEEWFAFYREGDQALGR